MVFALGVSHCDIRWNLWKIVCLVVFLVECCVIRVCMIWIASCASFWMESGKNSLNFFAISIGEMAKYPLTIYPPILRGIFGYLIPYAFVSYYPVGYLLGKSGMGVGVIVMPAVCVVMLGAAVLVMKRGLGRYESCGN